MTNSRWSKWILLSLLIAGLFFSGITPVLGTSNSSTAFAATGSSAIQEAYQPFSWDEPGPVSPVLHPGAPRAAGMVVEPLQQMDTILGEAIEQRLTPGAVVLVARRGIVVKHQAYGFAARYQDDQFTPLDRPVTMHKETLFDLASITKLFTTTAAMILYEQGKFSLDDPVAKYIPEFAQNGKEDVTIRQLMIHTSGFRAGIPLYNMGNSREERLQIVFAHPLDHEPGTTYVYSDLNMIVLGSLVERLSGERLDHFVRKNITAPLGMHNTMYNPPSRLKRRIAATEYQTRVERGLVWGEVHDEKAWSLDGVAGHAGLFATAKDLAIFAHMIMQGGKYGGKRILKPQTVQLMMENQTPQFPDDHHGLGWELNQGWYMDALTETNTLGHTGFTGTSLVVSPNNQTIVILLTNRVHPSRNMGTINPLRRGITRLTADGIPVPTDRKKVWFAGYGDNLDARLEAALPRNRGKKLTFDTWYRTEAPTDFGQIEVSSTGESWRAISEPFAGSSGNWVRYELAIPDDAKYIRFRYQTDDLVNGRGWYVKKPTLTLESGKKISVKWIPTDPWELRDR